MAEFLPGVQLCRVFYDTAVRPLLDEAFPGLAYAAARIGPGSDVLGYDTPRSTDHDWGPQLTLFLPDAFDASGVDAVLRQRLPATVLGWSTHFEPPGERVRVMAPAPAGGPIAHRVGLTTVAEWVAGQFGFSPDVSDPVDWLRVPAQRLAETVGGAVYHDGTGELTALRERLAWYPEPVWRFLIAAEWQQIAQEEAFPGRALEAGDEVGSLVVAARLARRVMRLGLLLRRRYPPYSKWLGTAFDRLGFPVDLTGITDPARRLDVLCDAYETLAHWQNDLRLGPPVEAARRGFHDRPYQVIGAARCALAVWPHPAPLGAVDQYLDSTDLLMTDAWRAAVLRPCDVAALRVRLSADGAGNASGAD